MKPEGKKQHPLAAKINYYKNSTGYSRDQLAEVVGMTVRSWDRYMNEPGRFTADQIVSLSRLFNTTELIDTLLKMAGGKLKRPNS